MTALSPPAASPARLLLVEHNDDVRDLLHTFLAREDYAVSPAPSLPEALALAREHTFHLILTDLFKQPGQDPFAALDPLRAEVSPTPVLVMTGWNIEEGESRARGLAGMLRKPFDLEEVLTTLTACLATPLSPEQDRQVRVVQAYFATLNARDWQALAALCTDAVTHSLPEDLALAGTIQGKDAFLNYVRAALARVPDLRYEEVLVASHPHGLTARSCSVWRGAAGVPQRQTSTFGFRLEGERLHQIIVRPGSGAHFTRLLGQATRPSPQGSAGPGHAARVLLVEADAPQRASLARTLDGAGYQVWGVADLPAALVLLRERCFHLVLADLFAGASLQGPAEAQLLRRAARPTPVGLITDQLLDPLEAASGGFAFLVPRRVDEEHLLWLLAALLRQPLSPEQERQADLVRRLFAAINAAAWEQLPTLCTGELRFYPPPGSAFHPGKALHGVQAYQADLEAVACRFPGYRLEEALCYAHPKGVAVRYQASWRLHDGRSQAHTGATLFGFQGERIARIAAWTNTVTLLPLQTRAERPSA